MAYRVEVLPPAARDLRRIYQTINAANTEQARAWFNGLTDYRVIYGLDETRAVISVVHVRHGAQDKFRPTD